MPANVSTDFERLKTAHPSYKQIRSMIDVPDYIDETCAVQVSYALNHSGNAIHDYAYPSQEVATGKVRAYKAQDNLFYIFAVPDMKVYLNNEFGTAENYKGTKADMMAKINGRHGLLAFGHRHIDLWQGSRFHWQDLYLDLWGFDSVTLRGIFFWEVTSEWGF
jgi:hypothetical protein